LFQKSLYEQNNKIFVFFRGLVIICVDGSRVVLYNISIKQVNSIFYPFILLSGNFMNGEIFMFVKDVTVQNKVGLHARPATFFIQKANEYKSSIWIEKEERRVNAKSLLGILSLGIIGGTTIRIIADGSDEQDAVEGLVDLVDSGFAEDAR